MTVHLVRIEYTAPIEEVEAVRTAHRAWLGELHARGLVLVGGPLLDHRGGVVVLLHDSREALETDLARDPYLDAEVATHRVDEFAPTMRLPAIQHLG